MKYQYVFLNFSLLKMVGTSSIFVQVITVLHYFSIKAFTIT